MKAESITNFKLRITEKKEFKCPKLAKCGTAARKSSEGRIMDSSLTLRMTDNV